MYEPLRLKLKAAIIAGLVIAWVGFFVLAGLVMGRVREFPGWHDFLHTSPRQNQPTSHAAGSPPHRPTLAATNVPVVPERMTANSTPTPERANPTAAPLMRPSPTVTPLVRQTLTFTPFVRPSLTFTPFVSPSLTPTSRPPTGYPTQCRNSLPTRLSPNQNGRVVLNNVHLRDTPTVSYGIRLSDTVRFVTTGEPVCARTDGNPGMPELLWWPVELVNVDDHRRGWLAESGLGSSGDMIYNIAPDY
ncbi:MAG: hypothetical protein JXQ72_02815 [Anaerolineae bacterium]|nr:hypothetical protein [Anaerolineae bacterium]